MSAPWITRTVTPDSSGKKIINEEGFGFQLGGVGQEGVRFRHLSRDQGIGEAQAGARSVVPQPGEVVPGEFQGLEVEWPEWYGEEGLDRSIEVTIYKQPLVSAVASPDPRAVQVQTKLLDFNNQTQMGGQLAAGATVTVFDSFDYLRAAASSSPGPVNRALLGPGASWLTDEVTLCPMVTAMGTGRVSIYAYSSLAQTSGSRIPWYSYTLTAASTSFPSSSWSHYWSPFTAQDHAWMSAPPNGFLVELENTSAGAYNWEARIWTRSAQ
jgi:hypothetical protein